MKKELIKNYVNKLTKQDIINYLSHECTPASNEEIDMIYNAIKNDYEEILNTNFMSYISNYKLSFNPELYKKIIEKYNEYNKFQLAKKINDTIFENYVGEQILKFKLAKEFNKKKYVAAFEVKAKNSRTDFLVINGDTKSFEVKSNSCSSLKKR